MAVFLLLVAVVYHGFEVNATTIKQGYMSRNGIA